MFHSYVDEVQAIRSKLITVNEAGNAIMKVDNQTQLNFGDKRNSIRVVPKDLSAGTRYVIYLHMRT